MSLFLLPGETREEREMDEQEREGEREEGREGGREGGMTYEYFNLLQPITANRKR